ncbi:cytochrome P450 [Salininema proteolyticum]|uniref:Cytochrome P450 n=1 Tax=Salininema proteolyticum TaxID=1607685 RepID=A0ABV8U1F1_9ACTN
MTESSEAWPHMTGWEKAKTTALHTLPALLGGGVMARNRTRAVLNRFTDPAMVGHFDRVREKYHGLPVWGPRGTLYLLTEADAREMLQQSATVFSTASDEKLAMLGRMQPDAVILTRGPLRERRREINDSALSYHQPVPADSETLARIAESVMGDLLSSSMVTGSLSFAALKSALEKVGRLVCFGSPARDDDELSGLVDALRRDGNSFYLKPGAKRRVERNHADLMERIRSYASRAEDFSLAARLSHVPFEDERKPLGQIPHWLMAMSLMTPIAMRTLTLLDAYPRSLARTREELDAADRHHRRGSAGHLMAQPYFKAVILDAVRLYPVVPNISRVTTSRARLGGAEVEEDTPILIPANFLARGRARGEDADRFNPDAWITGEAADSCAYLPFSKGPGSCPGRDVGMFLLHYTIGALLRRADFRSRRQMFDPTGPLPKANLLWRSGWSVTERTPAPKPTTAVHSYQEG